MNQETLIRYLAELRYAPTDSAIDDDYERGYRHAEDDIKRHLTLLLRDG